MISKIKILLAVFALFIYAESATAQVPQMFNYQGIARDAKGNPLGNQKMALKLSVMPTADATVPEYEETQIINTNEFGLYTLQIGNGTPVTGEMKTVKWETGNKYIKVAIDPTGGTNYADAGTSQLLSVPYAIYADKAGTASNGGHDKTRTGAVSSNAAHVAGDANYITKFTALNTIGKSLIYESAIGNIGIGTTAPGAKFQITNTVAAVQEHIRMQNLSTTGAGRFTMYNDGLSSYATFTKYGSAYAGGYAGIAAMYPYANLLAFGNNSTAVGDGRFLISTAGNAGISLYKGGTSKLKFHADYTTENVGIGGNADPTARVHLNNTDGTSMSLRITNNTTGHTIGDGLEITNTGNTAGIYNRENSTLTLGVNSNPTMVTITPAGNTELSGQIKIAGGAPGAGKILTSDAAGLATWQNPNGILPNGTAAGNTPYWDGSNWKIDNNNIYNNGGNVGINNTSPLMRTHINDTTGNIMVLENAKPLATNHTTGEYFKAGNLYTGAVKTIGTSTTSARMGLFTNADTFATDLVERVTISETGNVGIGDTTPSYKLDVNGTVHGTYLYSSGGADITGSAYLYSSAYIDGILDVDSDVNFDSDLNVVGNTTVGNNVNVDNVVTVKNGKGIVRSNDGTQLKTVLYSGGITLNLAAGASVSFNIGYSAFSATPIISIGNLSGTMTNSRFLLFTVRNANTNSAVVDVYNTGNATATLTGGTFRAIIIGAE